VNTATSTFMSTLQSSYTQEAAGESSREPHTGSIRRFFPTAGRALYNQQLHQNFRDHAAAVASKNHTKRQRKQHGKRKVQRACLLRTQNVRGLPKDQRSTERWFGLFRAKELGTQAAITLLQETHAQQKDVEELRRRYRATWGFNKNASTMSYWSTNENRAAGVAILLNPYKIQRSRPALTDRWSPHFMAIFCEMEGHEVLVVNVYAPHVESEREAFYKSLSECELQHDGPVVIGGDFNCTNHPTIDRSYQPTAGDHCSPHLRNGSTHGRWKTL
jgi:endonuclease/exonuclease/phosphatase (EEP) superfamily protein YafD